MEDSICLAMAAPIDDGSIVEFDCVRPNIEQEKNRAASLAVFFERGDPLVVVLQNQIVIAELGVEPLV